MIPETQRITLELTKAEDSEFFTADLIGAAISNMATLLKASARQLGANVTVFVSNATFEGHKASIKFAVITNGKLPKRKKKSKGE